MKKDIARRTDIERLVRIFYEKVKLDETIGFFFTDVVPVDWEKHLPKMCAFWENILFHTGDYEGDPLIVHRNVSRKQTTTPAHFKRWMDLFAETVDEYFSGPNAEKIKSHAAGIASVMQQHL